MVTHCNTIVHPEVLWAQRANGIFLTINVPDTKNPLINLQENKLTFESAAGAEGKTYAFELEFNGKINPETSKRNVTDRNIFLILDKAEHDQEWWPRLQKASRKPTYLKTDFARWKDEDEEIDEDVNPMAGAGGAGGMDFSQMMAGMGGGAGGRRGMDMASMMAGMGGGAGGKGGMDMASMMAGMGGGMAGRMGGEEGESDSDDEDLPELETATAE